jgi:hypothetical protein
VLLVREVHLEPCPTVGRAIFEALLPVSTAWAHGGFEGGQGDPIRAMQLLVPSSEGLELNPAAGEYCGVTPLFAPGAGQPTLKVDLMVSGPNGAPARSIAIETEAWLRPELTLPMMVIDEDQPEAGVTLTIDGASWWQGLDFDREDPQAIGARLVARLGSSLTARWEAGR